MYFVNKKIDYYVESCKVIVFDMNGLIIDDEPLQLQATNIILSKFNLKIDTEYWIKYCVGHKPKKFLQELIDKNNLFNINLDQIINEKDYVYADLIKDKVSHIVRDGVLELIDFLDNLFEKKVVLATSTTRFGTEVIIGKGGLNIVDKFSFIICGDEVKHPKPHPEIYFKVKEKFKNFNNFLVFEDSTAGIISAKKASMNCIAVPNSYTKIHDFSLADLVISDLSRNAKILQE